MKMEELKAAVLNHSGDFQCERIHKSEETKTVRFMHEVSPPESTQNVPAVGGLIDFYSVFGSIRFYFDKASGDSGRYIAPPSEWEELMGEFQDWMDSVEDDDFEDSMPEWISSCVVVGETPHSGNYILVATEGDVAGHVFEFDHDGFEFFEVAEDIGSYVSKLLRPTSDTLTNIATYMRFVEDGSDVQWWISELKDNNGNVVRTRD